MDNRRERRIPERNKVLIKSAEEHHDVSFGDGINAFTHDLSLSGARLFSERQFEVGTIIRISMELARSSQAIQIEGEVKWVKMNEDEGLFEFGVEFLHNISHTVLALIRHLYGAGTGISSSISPSGAGTN